MATLSEETFYISVGDLHKAFFEDKTWAFCRPEFYIRQTTDTDSVAEKRVALVNTNHDIEVKEAFAVEQDPETGIKYIVSGNTRTRALFELWVERKQEVEGGEEKKDSKVTLELKDDNFKLVPYKLFTEPLTLEDAIDFQVSTNDFTKKHNPYDIANLAYNLKIQFQNEFVASGMNEKKARGEATRKLCLMFKRTKQNLSQYNTVIENGSPTLHEYIRNEKISVDAAATLIQKVTGFEPGLDKQQLHQSIDKYLDTLWIKAQTNALKHKEGKVEIFEDFSIYKSAIIDYFNDLTEEAKAKDDAAKAGGSTGSTSPEGSTPPAPGSTGGASPKPTVTKERYVQDAEQVISRVYSIPSDVAKLENVKNVREHLESSLELVKQHTNVLAADTVLTLFAGINELVTIAMSDIAKIADDIKEAGGDNYDKYHKTLHKFAATTQKFLPPVVTDAKSATTVAPEATASEEEIPVIEPPATPSASEPTVIETDDHLITAR